MIKIMSFIVYFNCYARDDEIEELKQAFENEVCDDDIGQEIVINYS